MDPATLIEFTDHSGRRCQGHRFGEHLVLTESPRDRLLLILTLPAVELLVEIGPGKYGLAAFVADCLAPEIDATHADIVGLDKFLSACAPWFHDAVERDLRGDPQQTLRHWAREHDVVLPSVRQHARKDDEHGPD